MKFILIIVGSLCALLLGCNDSSNGPEVIREINTAISSFPAAAGGSEEQTMDVGVNTNWLSSWDTPLYLANLAANLGKWVKVDPSSGQRIGDVKASDQHRGAVFPYDPGDIHRAYITNLGTGIPAGIYTVRWSGNGEFAIGGYSLTSAVVWDTSGAFTFEYSGSGLMGAWFKGESLTSLEIIHEDNVAAYDAGNKWNPAYIEFVQNAGIKVLRAMNWGDTSTTVESQWSDRTLPTDIAYGEGFPIELMADFVTRTGIDIWWCIPARADDNYIEQAGALWKALLPPTAKLYVEFGNEVWNYSVPWGEGTQWLRYPNATRYTAVADPVTDTFYMPSHGLVTGDKIRSFSTFEDYINKVNHYWIMANGANPFVTVVDSDNFYVSYPEGAAKALISYDQTEMIYIKDTGLVDTLNENFVSRNEAAWDALELNMDRANMHYILSSWANSVSTTEERVNALVDKTRPDSVAVAFYYTPHVVAAKLDQDTTVMTPNIIGFPAHFGLYLATDNPTNAEVISGAGAIASQDFASVSVNSYTVGSQVTGLTDGVAYKAIFIVHTDFDMRFEVPYTQSETPISETFFESHEQHLKRERYDIADKGDSALAHAAVSQSIPIVGYEGGLAFDYTKPVDVEPFWDAYALSPEAEQSTLEHFLRLAGAGVAEYNVYKDVSTSAFHLSKNIETPLDYGPYRAYVEMGGEITSNGNTVFSDNHNIEVLSKPDSLETIYDLRADTSGAVPWSFEILSGNEEGVFTLNSNGQLSVTDVNALDWNVPNIFNLKTAVYNGETYDMASQTIKLWDIGKVVSFNKVNNAGATFGDRVFNPGDTISFTFWYTDKPYEIPAKDSHFIEYLGWDFLLHPSGKVLLGPSFSVTIDGNSISDNYNFSENVSKDYPHRMVITVNETYTISGISKTSIAQLGWDGVMRDLTLNQGGVETAWAMDSGAFGAVSPQNQETATIGSGVLTYVNVLETDWSNIEK
ncbi:hypothetical protein AU255_03775 [Methyloprofundus sedimenti]|uniref:Uncharacterized protein n=1 Tax=Methyloprofundus sedimenti TaxID=1420851 RepID=A0A1V8M651_9GAMM|nr:hypothetical protein [Methyloprofundus sedimenti]OQK17027.1 hypothetical protein AU255_03775 [Methyloprofundus sedimenti]